MSSYSGKAFRRSTLQYTGGRIANAAIAFFVFLWVARHLPQEQYANYVAAFACMELALVIFGFGMEWVTGVFIPEVRIKASGAVLQRFVWRCAFLQMGMLLIGALVLALAAQALARGLDLPLAAPVFQLYAIVIFVEGTGRVFRDQLLSSLLLQGAAQFSQFARNVVMLVFALSLSTHEHWQSARALAMAEIAASSISLALAAVMLGHFLKGQWTVAAQMPGWHPPSWKLMLRAGRNAWLSNIANLTWSGQAVVLLVTRFAGAEFTAAIGFARNLSEQVRRYLPMEFLLGIVRTLLVARYVNDRNAHLLGLRCAVLFRINLLFLLPLLVVAIVSGVEVCTMLSKGRYGSSHWLLVGWLTVLVFWAHHRVTDLMAHATGKSAASSRSSIRLLVAPVLLLLAALSQQWQFIFLTLAAAEIAYSWMVLSAIGIYRLNWIALVKMAGSALVAMLAIALPIWNDGPVFLLARLVLAFFITLGLSWALRAWSKEESDAVFSKA